MLNTFNISVQLTLIEIHFQRVVNDRLSATLTAEAAAETLTWEVAHFLRMSLVAPGGGVILLNNPVLSLGVGTNNVFLLFEKKNNR